MKQYDKICKKHDRLYFSEAACPECWTERMLEPVKERLK